MKDIGAAFSLMLELIQEGYEFSIAHEKSCASYDLSYEQGRGLISLYDLEY